jgi:hypothetical protein
MSRGCGKPLQRSTARAAHPCRTGLEPADDEHQRHRAAVGAGPPTIDAFVPGFNWTRVPQARVVETFNSVVSAAFSVESLQASFPQSPFAVPACVNVGNPGDGGGLLNATTSYSNDVMPNLIGKIALDPGWGHYEIKGSFVCSPTGRRAGPTTSGAMAAAPRAGCR